MHNIIDECRDFLDRLRSLDAVKARKAAEEARAREFRDNRVKKFRDDLPMALADLASLLAERNASSDDSSITIDGLTLAFLVRIDDSMRIQYDMMEERGEVDVSSLDSPEKIQSFVLRVFRAPLGIA